MAQVSLSDKRSLHLDPERQRLIQQQVMLDYRRQPSQVRDRLGLRVCLQQEVLRAAHGFRVMLTFFFLTFPNVPVYRTWRRSWLVASR